MHVGGRESELFPIIPINAHVSASWAIISLIPLEHIMSNSMADGVHDADECVQQFRDTLVDAATNPCPDNIDSLDDDGELSPVPVTVYLSEDAPEVPKSHITEHSTLPEIRISKAEMVRTVRASLEQDWRLSTVLPFPKDPQCADVSIGVRGVPKKWITGVIDALKTAATPEALRVIHRFVVACPDVPKEITVFYLMIFCCYIKTTECYDIRGKWTILPAYQLLLHRLAACTGDTNDTIEALDRRFRSKKCNKDPHMTTAIKTGGCFAFVRYIEHRNINEEGAGATAWTWIWLGAKEDITETTEPQVAPSSTSFDKTYMPCPVRYAATMPSTGHASGSSSGLDNIPSDGIKTQTDLFELIKTSLQDWKHAYAVIPFPKNPRNINIRIDAAGVPYDWNFNFLKGMWSETPQLNNDMLRFGLALSPNLKEITLFYLVTFCRLIKTTDCYNTMKGVSKFTQKAKLCRGADEWIISTAYKLLLGQVAAWTGDPERQIEAVDLCFRYKKSQTDPLTTVTCSTGSFVAVRYISHKDDTTTWTWVNIEYSGETFVRSLAQNIPTKSENTCAYCSRGPSDGINHLSRCGGCKLVYYCCKSHQQSHWQSHKTTCFKKN